MEAKGIKECQNGLENLWRTSPSDAIKCNGLNATAGLRSAYSSLPCLQSFSVHSDGLGWPWVRAIPIINTDLWVKGLRAAKD